MGWSKGAISIYFQIEQSNNDDNTVPNVSGDRNEFDMGQTKYKTEIYLKIALVCMCVSVDYAQLKPWTKLDQTFKL